MSSSTSSIDFSTDLEEDDVVGVEAVLGEDEVEEGEARQAKLFSFGLNRGGEEWSMSIISRSLNAELTSSQVGLLEWLAGWLGICLFAGWVWKRIYTQQGGKFK